MYPVRPGVLIKRGEDTRLARRERDEYRRNYGVELVLLIEEDDGTISEEPWEE